MASVGAITYTGELKVLACWCGITHAVPESLRSEQVRQHQDGRSNVLSIYCPLGHQYVPSGKATAVAERERREAAEARERAIRDQLEASERSNAALRGEITKAKKRASAGVCPCCKRTFQNVARHMAGQHPDFTGSRP